MSNSPTTSAEQLYDKLSKNPHAAISMYAELPPEQQVVTIRIDRLYQLLKDERVAAQELNIETLESLKKDWHYTESSSERELIDAHNDALNLAVRKLAELRNQQQ